MLLISSWISLYSIKSKRRLFFKHALLAISLGAIPVLLLVTIFILPNAPWYRPSFLIPLAGMILSSAKNTIGIAAERFENEILTKSLELSQRSVFKASLIPLTNTFFAVGLVSLPGMMTGQILSGVSPLIAVRYQIVVMTMVMGAGGIAAGIYLQLRGKN